MHISRNASFGPSKRHRLAIIVPVFIACLCISAYGGLASNNAQVQPFFSLEEQGIAVQSDTGFITFSGGILQMNDGMHTIAADGWVQARVHQFNLESWHGAFDVSYEQDVLTVAALTSPVYIHNQTVATIVPVRMQIRISATEDFVTTTPSSLPDYYLEDRLPRVRSLIESLDLAPAGAIDSMSHVGRKMSDALKNSTVPSVLPQFLSASAVHVSIALLHPAIRDGAFVTTTAEQMRTVPLFVLKAIPLSDRLETALHPVSKRLWADTLSARFVESSDAVQSIQELLPALEAGLKSLSSYPLRYKDFNTLLQQALEPYRAVLPEESFAFLSDDPVATLPVQAVQIEEPVAAKRISMDPQTALEQAQRRLKDMGVMQTTQSSVEVRSDGRVDVDNVVLGTAKGDVLLAFTYNPEEDTAENIQNNGQILPYNMELAAYVAWVRGE